MAAETTVVLVDLVVQGCTNNEGQFVVLPLGLGRQGKQAYSSSNHPLPPSHTHK